MTEIFLNHKSIAEAYERVGMAFCRELPVIELTVPEYKKHIECLLELEIIPPNINLQEVDSAVNDQHNPDRIINILKMESRSCPRLSPEQEQILAGKLAAIRQATLSIRSS